MDWGLDTFYVTGGTLPTGAPCYVQRQADTDLFSGLLSGEFCYVLSTRQMGKSSLMVRTAQRLRQDGRAVALLDLTAIGYNVTPEAWYDGLLTLLGEQLNLSDELEDFWDEHARLGPLQRWMMALTQVALPRLNRPLVIFIDEIDAVLSLSFSVDEFFNSIRECYNRRAQDPLYKNISFCLIGVAAPSDLVKEARVSPFNIGKRIVLTDFTQEECRPLLAGFAPIAPSAQEREQLLSRVLYWTDGHPYMTQRLCSATIESLTEANAPSALSPEAIQREVDRNCEQLFLTHQARDVDANLAFVRNRLLDGVIDIAGLLDMYWKALSGKRVADDDTSPFCTNLRLSGIVRVESGFLKVRNRIFERVFDRAWVRENMPNAELRRQQAAYRLGVLRTATAASIVVVIITGLAFANFFNVRRALKAEVIALEQSKLARNQAEYATRLVYAFNINLAAERYKTSGLTSVEETLEQATPEPDKPDLRGFEWYYLNRLCHNYRVDMQTNKDSIHSIAFSPNGKTLAGAGHSGEVHFWEAATGRHLRSAHALSEAAVWSLAWSPDGKTVVAGCDNKNVHVWEVASRRLLHTLTGHSAAVMSVAYSPDGKFIASGGNDKTARIWDAQTGREIRKITGFTLRGVWSVAFSPNGKMLATGGDDGVARLWDVATGRELRSMKGHSWYVYSLAFSPDGKTLATGSGDTNAILWEVDSGRLLYTLRGHSSYIYSVAFSSDGKTLGTGSWDKTVRLWDTHAGAQLKAIPNTQTVQSIAFHPDSKTLAVACSDSTLRLWSWRDDLDSRSFTGHTKRIDAIAFSPNSRLMATGGEDGTARVWDVEAGRVIESITGAVGGITR
ncbi:MAG: AAA-like domain-containing protein, partial [Armatimonadetes bacterium]|nr:AAA-like domain-containing protein [Armatimonadota bacterium]